ncbi:MAG: sensor histidine kinase, partial [Chloroflexi bacterium]|nr:sensor histidine kinase [Chloroflexota bacterium]
MAEDFPWDKLLSLAARQGAAAVLEEGLAFLLESIGGSAGAVYIHGSLPQRVTRGRIPPPLREALKKGEPSPAAFPAKDNILILPVRVGQRDLGWVALVRAAGRRLARPQTLFLSRWAQGMGYLAWLSTEVKILQEQRQQLTAKLREEQARIIRTQEDVRRELARDLHDGTVQRLSTIAMGLEYVRNLFQARPELVPDELESLRTLALKASQEARLLLFELRPLILESEGLAAALRAYAEQIPAEGVAIHLELSDFSRRLGFAKEEAIFDILQEAVTNARKHAQAENIHLRLQGEKGYLVCFVEDDGRGFKVTQAEKASERRMHFGLLNMRERAEMIKASLAVESAPGKGT